MGKVFKTTVLGFLAAVAGIAAPIGWDLWKEKRTLEIQYLAVTTFSKATQPFQGLEIRYEGKPIEELCRMEFALVNTGRTAFIASDQIAPLRLVFDSSGKILDHDVIQVYPESVTAELVVSEPENALELKFPLLNPGDYVRFAAVCEGKEPTCGVEGRIVNLPKVLFVDRRHSFENKPKQIGWTVYVVGTITSLLLVMFLARIPAGLLLERRAKRLHRAGQLIPGADRPVSEALSLLKTRLSYMIPMETKTIETALHGMTPDEPIGARHPNLVAAIEKEFSEASGTTCGAVGFGILIVVGTWYVASKLL